MEKKTGIVDRVNEYSDLGFKQYRRKSISEMRPYQEGEILDSKVSISEADKENGSPKLGDMIARNPLNHNDQWLVAEQYFKDNLEALSPSTDSSEVSDVEIERMALERFKIEGWEMKHPVEGVTRGSLQINHKLAFIEGFKKCLEMRSKLKSQCYLKERSNKIELLEAFGLFLEKNGYTDTDWRSEEPFAIDEFLKPESPIK